MEPAAAGHPVLFGTAELLRDLDVGEAWLVCVDGVPQSYVDLDDPTHLEFDYVRVLADAIDVAFPTTDPLRALHLGGAGCTLARWVAATRPGSEQTVVEADGLLVALLADELGLPGADGVDVRVADARQLLAELDAPYDVVIADLFVGAAVPPHVTTVEFARAAAGVLAPGGVYLANAGDGGELSFVRRLVATLASVFADVAVLAEPSVLRGRRFGNLIVAASPADLPLVELARRGAGRTPRVRAVAGRDFAADAAPLHDGDEVASPVPPNGWIFTGR